MKTRKFVASEIVEFNTLKAAVEHVKKERELHPRSKKFDSIILVNGEYGKQFNAFNYDFMKKLFNNKFDEILTPERREKKVAVAIIKSIGLKVSDFK